MSAGTGKESERGERAQAHLDGVMRAISSPTGRWLTCEAVMQARDIATRAGLGDAARALTETARVAANQRRLAAAAGEATYDGLEARQREAVVCDALRCRVVAGGGAGKTHVMIEKARRWASEGIAPSKIAFVTFTNKATDEIRERTADLKGMTVGTIHQLARRTLSRIQQRSLGTCPEGVDDRRRLVLVASWLEDEGTTDETFYAKMRIALGVAQPKTPGEHAEQILCAAMVADEWLKATRRRAPGTAAPEPADDHEAAIETIGQEVLNRFERLFERRGETDFEGQIIEGWRAAVEAPAGAAPWSRIIVDEWQDVNPAQSAFIHALARMTGPQGTPTRLTVVGDDWQSIFAFQGGDVALFSEFGDPSRTAPDRVVETVRLRRTWRFGQALADTTRAFALQAPEAMDKEVTGREEPERESAPVQIASMAARKPLATDGPGATRAVIETLAAIADAHEGPDVMILARERRFFANKHGTIAERVSAILDEWAEQPARMPKHLIGRSAKAVRASATKIAISPEGLDHEQVHAGAAELGLSVEIDTIHGAKGREADSVIILDGAPSTPMLEPVLDTAARLGGAVRSPDTEPRRLWYVAMTRARNTAYILVPPDTNGHSALVDELWHGADPSYVVGEDRLAEALEPMRPVEPCPSCEDGKGILVAREGATGGFVGCTSFSGAKPCGHTERRCQACGDGIMSRRPGTRSAKCLEPECDAAAPTCRCTPPRPMWLRTQRASGLPFWGCQRFGRPESCNATRPARESDPTVEKIMGQAAEAAADEETDA